MFVYFSYSKRHIQACQSEKSKTECAECNNRIGNHRILIREHKLTCQRVTCLKCKTNLNMRDYEVKLYNLANENIFTVNKELQSPNLM